MNLNINDLRRGSLIAFSEDSSVCCVKGIDADELGLTVLFLKSKEEVWIETSQFEPIPICNNVVIQSGAELVASNEYYEVYRWPNGFYLCQSKKNWDTAFKDKAGRWYVGDNHIEIKYLHELQDYSRIVNSFEIQYNIA